MKEALSVVTRKGQITVPAEIRRAIGLRKGDKVAMSIANADTGEVTLRPVRTVTELTFGAVRPRRRPENFKEIRRLFEEGQAAEAFAEGRSGERT